MRRARNYGFDTGNASRFSPDEVRYARPLRGGDRQTITIVRGQRWIPQKWAPMRSGAVLGGVLVREVVLTHAEERALGIKHPSELPYAVIENAEGTPFRRNIELLCLAREFRLAAPGERTTAPVGVRVTGGCVAPIAGMRQKELALAKAEGRLVWATDDGGDLGLWSRRKPRNAIVKLTPEQLAIEAEKIATSLAESLDGLELPHLATQARRLQHLVLAAYVPSQEAAAE